MTSSVTLLPLLQSEITTNDMLTMIMKTLSHQLRSPCVPDVIQADWVPPSCLSTPIKSATGPLSFADPIEVKHGLGSRERRGSKMFGLHATSTFKSHVSNAVKTESHLESKRPGKCSRVSEIEFIDLF